MITDFIKRGKDNVVEIIKENTGLLLDVVNPGPGNTGTSTTGNQGRRFFRLALQHIKFLLVLDFFIGGSEVSYNTERYIDSASQEK